MNEYAHLMPEVEPAEEVAAEARKYFRRHAARGIAAPVLKRSPAKRRAASPGKAKSRAPASKAKRGAK